jgi:transposase
MEAALSPSPSELRLDGLRITPNRIIITAAAKRPSVRCPACGEPSQRIHSRYTRRIADLPWHGIPVQVELCSRRFFCDTAGCLFRIFTERLPATVPPYGRRTLRLSAAHRPHMLSAAKRVLASPRCWVLARARTRYSRG